MRDLFIRLDGTTHNDPIEWGRLLIYQFEERTVAVDTELGVTTVFTGYDGSHGEGKAPLPYETLSELGEHHWPTWDAALAGHQAICERLRAGSSLDFPTKPAQGS